MIIQGRVTKVNMREGVNESTGNPWKRVEFVVEFKEYPTDKAYDRVVLESWHENVVNNIKEGMMVKAVISHSTHDYNGRTYNDINLWEVHAVKNQAQVAGEQYAIAAAQAQQVPAQPEAPAEDPDDLPF